MSLVRHKDKKSGSIIVYESTSHYDPVTKQSRPIRKYLGIEDPITGELIPSSGKRGRKKSSEGTVSRKQKKDMPDYKFLYEQLKKECADKDKVIKKLERDNKVLRSGMIRLRDMASDMIGAETTKGE